MNLYIFRTVPLSTIRNFSLYGNGVCHTGLLTACEQNHSHPDPARKLSAKLYEMYYCRVYSETLLIMERGTVQNM